jgi:hypothetical protein
MWQLMQPFAESTEQGDVTMQATGNTGASANNFAQEFVSLGWLVVSEECSIPTLALRRVVVREPRGAILVASVTADHRQVAFARDRPDRDPCNPLPDGRPRESRRS